MIGDLGTLHVLLLIGGLVLGYVGGYLALRREVNKIDERLNKLATKDDLLPLKENLTWLRDRMDSLLERDPRVADDEILDALEQRMRNVFKPLLREKERGASGGSAG